MRAAALALALAALLAAPPTAHALTTSNGKIVGAVSSVKGERRGCREKGKRGVV